jgi:hypothetical protein
MNKERKNAIAFLREIGMRSPSPHSEKRDRLQVKNKIKQLQN